jgi:hypothetical protein
MLLMGTKEKSTIGQLPFAWEILLSAFWFGIEILSLA